MHILWAFLFFINFGVAIHFLPQADTILSVRFNLSGEIISTMGGSDYAKFMGGIVLIINVTFCLLFLYAHQTRFLKYARFPNRKYWKSSPDRRLEVLGRLQDVLCFTGFLLNAQLLFTQLFIHKVSLLKGQIKPMLAQSYFGIMGISFFFLLIFILMMFRVPKY